MTGSLGTIDTTIGPAEVLHRLLLAIDCVDGVLQRRAGSAVRIGRELPVALLPRGYDPSWPCLDFAGRGTGRAVGCFDYRTPVRTDLVIRIADPSRQRLVVWCRSVKDDSGRPRRILRRPA